MTIKEPGVWTGAAEDHDDEEYYVDENIGPWLAAEYLKTNKVNRSLRKQARVQYAQLMGQGEWMLTPQGISFDKEGNLIDGQTRLSAIVLAKVTVPMRVWRNVDPLSRFAMDTGQKRSLTDALVIKGIPNPKVLASATTSLHRYQVADNNPRDVAKARSARLHPIMGLKLFERNPGLQESIVVGARTYRGIGMPAAAASATHYQMSSVEPQEAEVFFEYLVSGAGLDEGHPILALRNRVHNSLGDKPRHSDIEYGAWMRKAWNAYISGENLYKIYWAPGGSKREPFPKLATTY